MKQQFTYRSYERGFFALISTVVISAILLILMTETGLASFYARFDALGIENKRTALYLAESCTNVALLALATSTDSTHYNVTNQEVTIGSNSDGPLVCTIKSVEHDGSNTTINTYASSNNSFSNISARVSLSPDIQIISWNFQ